MCAGDENLIKDLLGWRVILPIFFGLGYAWKLGDLFEFRNSNSAGQLLSTCVAPGS